MALLNYTTSIEAIKTVGEIQGILAGHGAKSILTDYTADGQVEALAFKILTPQGEIGIRLPVNPEAVLQVLTKQNRLRKVPGRYINRPQAVRVAWRILKDWVQAQMAILETEMVKMEQIFLPYAITKDGQTVYDLFEQRQFKMLGEGE
ncbi:unnamed protein product [marine sediment metagenome]|uniref:Uncharacterized protein n=1 Tax=marine sediment metagenome TaxID=412755 RepID=X1TUW6_9ZZZZ